MSIAPRVDALLKKIGGILQNERNVLEMAWSNIESQELEISFVQKSAHFLGRFIIGRFANRFKKLVAKYEVIHLERLPASGPVIIASRHCIDMEYALFIELIPRKIRYVANIRQPSKKITHDQVSFFDPERGSRLAQWAAKEIFNFIQLYDPRPEDKLFTFFKEVAKAVINDECLVIFPEGGVLAERNLLWGPFESGTIVMAQMAERYAKKAVPILPLGICYEWADSKREGKPIVYFRLGIPKTVNEIPGKSTDEKILWLEQEVKRLSKGRTGYELSYQELRNLDPKSYYTLKENLRKEFAVKEISAFFTHPRRRTSLKNILNVSSVGRRLTPEEKEVWSDFLRLTAIYIQSSKNSERLKTELEEVKKTQIFLQQTEKITRKQQQVIMNIYANQLVYEHESHIFHDHLDTRLKQLWEKFSKTI